MKKKQLINKIRSKYSGMKDFPRETLINLLDELAHKMFKKNAHFIFELVQNAEDNEYLNDTPSFYFFLKEMSLNGENQVVLIIENNEIGFNEENVKAICKAGKSTKAKNKNKGYIGEKGIGFKSVFKVTSCPCIFSNGFAFSLPEKDEETGLGYIVPKWIDNPPKGIKNDWTTIILPLDKGEEKTIKGLQDISPETILFLKKLKSVEITISLPDEIHEIIIEKSDSIYPVVELTYMKNLENIQAQKYWCGSLEVTKPDGVNPEERQDITEREVSVALPLNPDEQYSGKLFAYLLVWENTGLPFLINADFLLVSSREDIREDETWNEWLRDSVPDAYTKVFMDCLKDERLPEGGKYAIYASIPFSSHRDFLEPVCENIQKSLKDEKCLITEPDGHLREPEHAKTASKEFRELLDGYPYPKLLQDTPLVRKQLEPYEGQLESIGVKGISDEEIGACFHDRDWVALHDYDWLIKCYNYLSSQNFNGLSQCPIVPVEAENGIRWTCGKEQPIYFECDKECIKILDKAPDCVRVPLAFLHQDFFKRIEDDENIRKWMNNNNTLRIYDFSDRKYASDVLDWFKQHYKEISESDFLSATLFLSQFADTDINFKSIPILIADGRRMLLSEAKASLDVQAVVTPEGLDPETGWQNIFVTENDRKHFLILSDAYIQNFNALKNLIKPDNFPKFRKDAITPYIEDDNYVCPELTEDEIRNLEDARNKSATKRRNEIILYRFFAPDGFKMPVSKRFSASLINWLKKHYRSNYDPSLFQIGLKAKIEYPYRGTNTLHFSSNILILLIETPWLPTTKGFVRPKEVFLPEDHIKELLGDSVPYFEEKLPQSIIELLGIKTKATIGELISVLEQNSQNDTGSRELAERIYQTLYRFPVLPENICNRLKQNELIFIPAPDRWVSFKYVIWKDRTDVLGSDFIYLKKIYPKLKDFFVDTLDIKENADTEFFARRWLKLQEENEKKQRELVEKLYREICPTATAEGKPGWWNEFIGEAKIYTQSDIFEEPEKVLVPDDESLKEVFINKGVSFAWRPKNGSFNNWVAFCKAFGTPLLSESVSEKLAEYNEDDEVICGNRRLTGATVKMIAAWLREHHQNEYNRLLKDGSFRKLFEAEEVEYHGEIKVYFSLKTSCLEMEEERSTSVFWDATNYKLICSSNVENDDIANRIAKWLLPNCNTEHLASWIENILGAENTKRLDRRGWKVPQEILELSRELDASCCMPDDLNEEVESANDPDKKADSVNDSTEKSEDTEMNDIEMTAPEDSQEDYPISDFCKKRL